VRLVVVLRGEINLPHALLEQVDKEQVEAGHQAHQEEEAEERGDGELEHLVVHTLGEEVGEGDLHLAGNFENWREIWKRGGRF